MNLIYIKNYLTLALNNLLNNRLKPLFKFSLILGARNKSAHIQRVEHFVLKVLRHISINYPLCQALSYGCLSNSRFSYKNRIVLCPSAKNLQNTPNLLVPSNNRVQFARLRPLVEVDCISA